LLIYFNSQNKFDTRYFFITYYHYTYIHHEFIYCDIRGGYRERVRYANRGQITERNISSIYLLRESLVSVLGTELLEVNSFFLHGFCSVVTCQHATCKRHVEQGLTNFG